MYDRFCFSKLLSVEQPKINSMTNYCIPRIDTHQEWKNSRRATRWENIIFVIVDLAKYLKLVHFRSDGSV